MEVLTQWLPQGEFHLPKLAALSIHCLELFMDVLKDPDLSTLFFWSSGTLQRKHQVRPTHHV